MGKPKYYLGQLLRDRVTSKIHYIKHIADKDTTDGFDIVIYTVPPIETMGAGLHTPNDVLRHWVIGNSKMVKKYQVVPKREQKVILEMAALLYDKT